MIQSAQRVIVGEQLLAVFNIVVLCGYHNAVTVDLPQPPSEYGVLMCAGVGEYKPFKSKLASKVSFG